MKYFPIFLDLENRNVVVAGGGEAAAQKLRLLLKTDAHIIVTARQPCDEIRALAAAGRITLVRRAMRQNDLEGASLVYAATEDRAEDSQVAAMARGAGVPVNAVDQPALSNFITPAIVDRDPVTIAIGTEGSAPVLARAIKSRIEAMLPAATGAMARLAASWRVRLALLVPDAAARRKVWQQFFASSIPTSSGSTAVAAAEIRLAALAGAAAAVLKGEGRVSLVGAGPGDPELLTLKARRRIHEADVVVYDRLVGAGILELARREAKFIPVGKAPGRHSVPQSRINDILVREAGDGHDVVRLKGGDPLVFGRADEEIGALAAAGIAYDIVPGITSASAAAASAGFSLTRRGRNTSFRLLTAHDANGAAEHDWRTLARDGEAFAIYMGVGSAAFVEARLLAHGAKPSTAVTIVERASLADEKQVQASIEGIADAMKANAISGPAIIFVGLASPAVSQINQARRAASTTKTTNPAFASGDL